MTKDNYFYTLSQLKDFIVYFGVDRVLEDIIDFIPDPNDAALVRTVVEDLKEQKEQEERFNRLYAEWQSQQEDYDYVV